MTLDDLMDLLKDYADEFGGDTEVRMAQQPRWAFEYSITGAAITPPRGRRTEPCVYLIEGSQLGYLPHDAAVACEWAEPNQDDEEAR